MTERSATFHDELLASVPRLRAQALALTRNATQADDLVQETVAKALAAHQSFQPGSSMGAWTHRILRNEFLTRQRRKRPTDALEDAPDSALTTPGRQEDSMVLGELRRCLHLLPADQRTALMMVVVQGMSYEEVASAQNCAVGTAKCRVFRARQRLQSMLMGETTTTSADLDAAETRSRSSQARAGQVLDEHRI